MFCLATVRCLLALSLLACIATACPSSDGHDYTCPASQQPSQTAAAVANYYASEEEEAGAQEDVDDTDMTMHLQMKVSIDTPPVTERLGANDHMEKHQPQSEVHKIAQDSVRAQELKPLPKVDITPAVLTEKSRVALPWGRTEAFGVLQSWARSMPLIQIALVLGIINVFLFVWKLMNMREEKATKGSMWATHDASAKLHHLLRAMKFEPIELDDDKIIPLSAKKCPVIYTPSENDDSSCSSDEEPEAEAALEEECAPSKPQKAEVIATSVDAQKVQMVVSECPGQKGKHSSSDACLNEEREKYKDVEGG